MSAERLGMETIRKILWLYFYHGLRGNRQIARAAARSKSAGNRCLCRAHERGVTEWQQIEPLDDVQLEGLLGLTMTEGRAAKPMPDFVKLDEELRRRDHQVTLRLLWEEYRTEHPDGYNAIVEAV